MKPLEKLYFLREEAVLLKSVDKAVIAEFIRWSIYYKQSNYNEDFNRKYFFDGYWWMQDSMTAWNERMPWLSERTIRRYLNDMCEEDWIAKYESKNPYGGSEPNFYRLSKLSGEGTKNCPSPLADCQEGGGQTVRRGGDKLSSSSLSDTLTDTLTNIQKNIYVPGGHPQVQAPAHLTDGKPSIKDKAQQEEHKGIANALGILTPEKDTPKKPNARKEPLRTWEESDPFASIFTNLIKLSICKAKFETEDYRRWLTAMMESDSLTISELVRLTNEWQEYHNEKTQQPKVAKASFRTWVTNYVERRSKNGQSARFAKAGNSRPDYSADNGKFKNTRDDKPW